MAEPNQNIDFEIIWRKIHDCITDSEEALLNDWLAGDASHRKYFDDACRYYKNGSQFLNTSAELKNALHNIYQTLGIHTPFRRTLVVTITGIAASILFLIIFQFYKTQQPEFIGQTQSMQSIVPGSEKAVLILSDGTEHDLTSGESSIIAAEGIEIKNTGTKLEYKGTGEHFAEMKYNTLKIPRGGEYFLILSDSTKVWLNSETTLRFPVQFAADVRNVELIGEAYFEVSKNEKVPFIVSSGNQQIKVLGTQFNISSYADNENIYTTLVEGKVEVSLTSDPATKMILKPSEQSCFAKNENQLVKRNVDISQYTAWKDGRFVFKNEPLDDIMKTLSKWYNVEIVFANEDDRKLRFTGNLERYADFGNILEKIEKTNEVDFEITNNTITIK